MTVERGNGWTLYLGDCIEVMRALDAGSAQACVTSPPYWGLRDYGVDGQLGLEKTPDEYVTKMVDVFREVRRVLRDDGTLWLNLGDSYAATTRSSGASLKSTLATRPTAAKTAAQREQGGRRVVMPEGLRPKDLVGIPWRVAFALQADGWYLRSDIIWHKPNPMPESVTDRPTKAHEYVFLLSKGERYAYDADAVAEIASSREPGNVSHKGRSAYEAGDKLHRTKAGLVNVGPRDTRNARTVWTVASQPCAEAHFAVFPEELPRRCILAGAPRGATVLDPFTGSGTTGNVALKLGRRFVGTELNPQYHRLACERIGAVAEDSTVEAKRAGQLPLLGGTR